MKPGWVIVPRAAPRMMIAPMSLANITSGAGKTMIGALSVRRTIELVRFNEPECSAERAVRRLYDEPALIFSVAFESNAWFSIPFFGSNHR